MQIQTPRSYHAAVPLPEQRKLLLLGGFDGERYFDGSIMFDLQTGVSAQHWLETGKFGNNTRNLGNKTGKVLETQ